MMTSGTYHSLDLNDKYLLAIHTLFFTKGSESIKVRKIMGALTGNSTVDLPDMYRRLGNAGLLISTEYNWRSDSFDYEVGNDHLIPFMLYLYQSEQDLCKEVLERGKALQPTDLQRMLWTFITSDFKDVPLTNTLPMRLSDNLDVFLPVMLDTRFAPLLMLLNVNHFTFLVSVTIENVFNNESLIDTEYIRTLTNAFLKSRNNDEDRTRLLCLYDLYDYLAYGRRPANLLANNKNHRMIAAVHEVCNGNMEQAYMNIVTAMRLHNRDGHNVLRYSCMQIELLNYLCVLISYKAGTDDSARKARAIYATGGKSHTITARVLYEILYNAKDNAAIRGELGELARSRDRMTRLLAAMMGMYIGVIQRPDERPDWLIMQHEMRRYVPMDGSAQARADAVFGEKGILSSVYRKQEWENVLDELMGKGNVTSGERDRRIVYIMEDTGCGMAAVKLQTRTKSGAWSSGKAVSVFDLMFKKLTCMAPADVNIAQSLNRKAEYYSDEVRVTDILPYMKDDNRLYVGRRAPYTLVDITEEMPYLNLQRTQDGFAVSSNVSFDNHDEDSDVIVTHTGTASINYIHLNASQKVYYQKLLALKHFPLEAEPQLRDFLNSIGGKIEVNSDLIDGGSTLPMTEGTSELIMQMRPTEGDNYAISLFVRPLEGGNIKCRPGEGDEIVIDSRGEERTRVRRDIAREAENLRHFALHTDTDCSAIGHGEVVDAYKLLPILEYAQQNRERVSCEWPEGAQIRIRTKGTSKWNGAIRKTENGWFELEGSLQIDNDKVITMAQLLDLVGHSRGRFIRLEGGEFLALSDKLRRQLDSLSAIATHSRGRLHISPFAAALLGGDILNGELTLSEDEELLKVKQCIKDASTYTPEVPDTLNATLRKYQKDGFRWMARLNKWGAGALLADDMGLGKTVQTITFLLSKAGEGPALVVAPASVAPNWKTEIERFAPTLNAIILNTAENRSGVVGNAAKGDVVITTYGLLNTVKELLTEKRWTTICLDEAHIIKNRGAKTSAAAMQLKSDNRVMLTGTPVQNHLGELWNLFQFVNPGLLGTFDDFNRRFIIPIEQHGDKERQKELDKLVKPFMLRRTKDKVAKELPAKEEIYQHVTMTEEESAIYELLRRKAETMLVAGGTDKVSMATLAEITRLRQCSCDVRLVEEGRQIAKDTPGSKITALVELLQTVMESITAEPKHRAGAKVQPQGGVLVFSQFTSYLALIREALDKAGIPYLYIDGAVDIKTRQRLVEEFQQGSCPVFLISLKAGGLGLNLTRANYVIHMDPWWNPAIEAQATDRAHRIGQNRSVTVYHIIAEGTIEEKIQRMHERKQALVQNILESTDMSHKLTGEDLLRMVSRA